MQSTVNTLSQQAPSFCASFCASFGLKSTQIIRHFAIATSASLLAAQAFAQASFADVVEKADPAVVSIRTAERVTQEQIERFKRSQNPFSFIIPNDDDKPRSPQTPRGQARPAPKDAPDRKSVV